MNEILEQERVELNLLSLQSLLTDMLLGDLSAEDLNSHEVSPDEHEFHLVENEFNLFLGLKRAVSLDLNLLNDLGCLVNLAILF